MVLKLDEGKIAQDDIDGSQLVPTDRGGGSRTFSRLNFLRVGMVGGLTLLGWRLWDMQKPLQENFSGEAIRKPALPDTRYITAKAPRGLIYDRSGKQKLVNNTPNYSVTITANYLPNSNNGKTKEEKKAIAQQRQAVYDNLAHFLGMGYYIGLIPEQVNGIKKKDVFTNPARNAILNELEIITGKSARDWDKELTNLEAQKRDKSFYPVNEKELIPIEQFDRYVYLRDKFDTGVLFLSEGERKMLEARLFTPEYQPVEVWSNLSREDAMLLDEKRLDFPGVGIQTSYQREYADARLYAHILGYTGRFPDQDQLEKANKQAYGDNSLSGDPDDPSAKIKVYEIDDKIGLTGVEASMEPFLRGRKGAKEVVVSSTGHIIETVKVGKPPQPGNSIVLTIDMALQKQVADSLEKWIGEANKTKPAKVREGAAVVTDVNTGEVLAMVAFPFYNNNLYSKPGNKWTDAEVAEMLDDVKAVQVNRAIDGRYAPGSTFKLITAAAVLNEKKFSRFTPIFCNKAINIPTTQNPTPSQRFRCWDKHGTVDLMGAIEQSCDVYFYNAAVPDETSPFYGRSRYYLDNSTQPNYFQGLGINLLNGYMALFNLGQKSGLEILSEYRGTLPGPHTKLWSIGETMTTAIGQGDLEMTPLQMNMVTAAFATGGKLYQPRIVRQIKDPDGKVIVDFEPKLIRDVTKTPVKWSVPDPNDNDKPKPQDFVLTPGVIQAVREGMLAVTGVRGTANRTMYNQTGRLKVGGKTGTAEYGEAISKDKDGNDVRATRAWFTAFAPYDKPEIAVTVMITAGDNVIEGSTFAVPAVKEILEYKFADLVKQKA